MGVTSKGCGSRTDLSFFFSGPVGYSESPSELSPEMRSLRFLPTMINFYKPFPFYDEGNAGIHFYRLEKMEYDEAFKMEMSERLSCL